MRYDRTRLVAFSFMVICIGAAIYVSTASLNYLRLYPALNQLQDNIRIDRVSFGQGQASSQSLVTCHITVDNPSDYSGFRIGKVYVVISFYVDSNRNMSLFTTLTAPNASIPSAGSLGPKSVVSLTIPIALTPDQSSRLASFNAQYSGHVMAEVSYRVDVNTFLVSVTGSSVYTGTQDTPLSLA
jgi:hypothetical protein